MNTDIPNDILKRVPNDILKGVPKGILKGVPKDILKGVPNDIPRPVTDSTSRQTRPHRFTPLFRYTFILVLLLVAKAVVPGWRYHVSEPGHQHDNHLSHRLTTAEREKLFL